jgi:hypothetical protein
VPIQGYDEVGMVSDSEMRIFGSAQGRTRVCGEVYAGTPQPLNPRRTPSRAKKTISGRTLDSCAPEPRTKGEVFHAGLKSVDDDSFGTWARQDIVFVFSPVGIPGKKTKKIEGYPRQKIYCLHSVDVLTGFVEQLIPVLSSGIYIVFVAPAILTPDPDIIETIPEIMNQAGNKQ